MKKKRLLAWLMTLVMMVGLMPATAFAEDIYDKPVYNTGYNNGAVKITKSVGAPVNGNYPITMDAYVTGAVETTQPDPLDIVLVLDVSGSMADDITIYQEGKSEYVPVTTAPGPEWLVSSRIGQGIWDAIGGWYNSFIKSDFDDASGEYYYSADGQTFHKVTSVSVSESLAGQGMLGGDVYNKEYSYTYEDGTAPYVVKETAEFVNGFTKDYWREKPVVPTNIYKLVVSESNKTISKMDALKTAANAFITETAKRNAGVTETADMHNISIVKFAGDNKTTPGDDVYGNRNYNYSQVVNGLTAVDTDGKATLTTSINALTASGATAADRGMAHAKAVLEGSEREKVVVFFTDGEPNHGNGFDEEVAAATINTAQEMKADDTTIYTVGVLNGANPSSNPTADNAEKIDQYMHAVSSNYPAATATGNADRDTFSVT